MQGIERLSNFPSGKNKLIKPSFMFWDAWPRANPSTLQAIILYNQITEKQTEVPRIQTTFLESHN